MGAIPINSTRFAFQFVQGSLVASHLSLSLVPERSKRIECPERSRRATKMYYTYIIANSSDELYVGVTEDMKKRLLVHNSDRGAQFTKHNGPFELVFLEEYATLAEARTREIQIKKWRRDKKASLINRFSKKLPTKL